MPNFKFLIVTTVPQSLGFFSNQISILKKNFDVELVSSPGVELDEICNKESVVGHSVFMKRDISILSDFISLLKLLRLFHGIKPKVVHGNTPKGGFLSMLASYILRIPNRIYYLHGLRYQGEEGLKRIVLMFMEKISCFCATDLISVSFGVKETLIKDKITSKNITVIGNGSINGINSDFFDPNNTQIPDLRKEYEIKDSDFVFGYIGRIVKDKGINELILAFKEINITYSGCKLLLIGRFDDNHDPISDESKSEISKNKNIVLAGFQSDVRPFLKIMDVFIFPSYREGFGLSLLEAAAMNVPSIASDISGCNEIISNDFNGILIEPKSTISLVNAMSLLIGDKQKLKSLSLNTRQFVLSKYEQHFVWEKTLAHYKSICYK
jgi:glycosyltransferase involved in cell wall biosynthesis